MRWCCGDLQQRCNWYIGTTTQLQFSVDGPWENLTRLLKSTQETQWGKGKCCRFHLRGLKYFSKLFRDFNCEYHMCDLWTIFANTLDIISGGKITHSVFTLVESLFLVPTQGVSHMIMNMLHSDFQNYGAILLITHVCFSSLCTDMMVFLYK